MILDECAPFAIRRRVARSGGATTVLGAATRTFPGGARRDFGNASAFLGLEDRERLARRIGREPDVTSEGVLRAFRADVQLAVALALAVGVHPEQFHFGGGAVHKGQRSLLARPATGTRRVIERK